MSVKDKLRAAEADRDKLAGLLQQFVDRRMRVFGQNAPKGVLVCCPTYGQMATQETFSSAYMVAQMLAAADVPAPLLSLAFSDVVDVRNVLITRFYDDFPEYSHCLMFDNDMAFGPDLIRGMINLDKPIVGTLYCRREVPKDGNPLSIMIGHLLDEERQEVINGFMRVRHVGGGVLLIKREVVTEMLKKLPEINDTEDPGRLSSLGVTRVIRAFEKMRGPLGNRLSEDYSFCERWRQCGGEIWANISQPIGHVGPFNHVVQYSDYLIAPKAAEAA